MKAAGFGWAPKQEVFYAIWSPGREDLAVELAGDQGSDLRADIFRLAVAKGWTLLELRRDSQTLEDVFRDLTKGDDSAERGARTNGGVQ